MLTESLIFTNIVFTLNSDQIYKPVLVVIEKISLFIQL